MAKRGRRSDRTGRSLGSERHVRLHHWMLRTVAYKALSLAGKAALVELYGLYNGQNNGQIFMGVRQLAQRLDIAPNTAQKALRDLLDKGFTRIKQKGSFNLKSRHATEWILTEFEYGGQLATKDFFRWKTGLDIYKPGPIGDTVGIKDCDKTVVKAHQKEHHSIEI